MNELEQYKKQYEETYCEPFPTPGDEDKEEFIPTCTNQLTREFGSDEAFNICNLIWEQR